MIYTGAYKELSHIAHAGAKASITVMSFESHGI